MPVLTEKTPSKRKPEMVFRERTDHVSRNGNFEIENVDINIGIRPQIRSLFTETMTMNYDNVIIFGAGASVDAGIPLLNNFVDTMWSLAIREKSKCSVFC